MYSKLLQHHSITNIKSNHTVEAPIMDTQRIKQPLYKRYTSQAPNINLNNIIMYMQLKPLKRGQPFKGLSYSSQRTKDTRLKVWSLLYRYMKSFVLVRFQESLKVTIRHVL